MKSPSDSEPEAGSSTTASDIRALRDIRRTLYQVARGDAEFTALVDAYDGALPDLADPLYEILSADQRDGSSVNWHTLRHVASYMASVSRYAEAQFFCDLWSRQQPSVDCWRLSALVACHQGDFTRWSEAYENATALCAPLQVLLVLRLAAVVTFSQGRGAIPLAEELLRTILPGGVDPIVPILIEDAAIQNECGALLVDLSRIVLLDPPPRSRRAGYMTHLLRRQLVGVLRQRAIAAPTGTR